MGRGPGPALLPTSETSTYPAAGLSSVVTTHLTTCNKVTKAFRNRGPPDFETGLLQLDDTILSRLSAKKANGTK